MGLNKQVKIILIETSNSGNIGSTLRAMKTMGFGSLCLVNPKEFPSEETTTDCPALPSEPGVSVKPAKVEDPPPPPPPSPPEDTREFPSEETTSD